MQPHDFWNLAGRAGRWGDEFQGNIICIDPNRTDAWPTGVPKRARYPILRETDLVLNSSEALEAYVGTRWDAPMEEIGKTSNSQYEQVCAYLLATFMREGSITSAPFAKRHDGGAVSRLNGCLAALAERIALPADLIGRHPGVNAVGMQRLLNYFAAQSDELEKLLPVRLRVTTHISALSVSWSALMSMFTQHSFRKRLYRFTPLSLTSGFVDSRLRQ